MKRFCFLAALSALLMTFAQAYAAEPVQLHWLDGGAPTLAVGSAWGVPFAPGEIQKSATFSLTGPDAKAIPLQSWPLAYWPDGSIKWQGFAAVPGAGSAAGPMSLTVGSATAPPAAPVKVAQTADMITVTSGRATYRIPTKGAALIDTITLGETVVARGGRLVALDSTVPPLQLPNTVRTPLPTSRDIQLSSDISSVTVEQSGPVRAVIKIEGKFVSVDQPILDEKYNTVFPQPMKSFLPFTVRLYFYANTDTVKIVHSFIYDGDQDHDFIKGIGISFSVPLREKPYNRHVRFAGDDGLFMEPVQPVVGRRVGPSPAVDAQVQGQPYSNPAQESIIAQMAIWDAYKQTQLSPDGYEIDKRTNDQSAPIRSIAGHRAKGLAFLGDTTGGLALGLKNFWQMYPTELEISGASTSTGTLTCWLYSPDAQPMDMRHYDTKEHGLEAAYEDITPGLSTATGIARTHELLLCPFSSVPSAQTLSSLADAVSKTPQIVCTPQYLHGKKAFGVWSLPDRTNPSKAAIENELDSALAFYQGQVEQRKWYSFWDFGDFMHSYDSTRHEWRYDVGGYAWANTELMPDMWLWYSFLRTGRADIFRMAEAMTRETQEVDVYHLGDMKGLGSRHNVRHWGDGAKELRVSEAALKRFYYYLTTDERTGDLITEVIDADQALLKTDPLRKVEADRKYPTHVRVGPDWFALCSNWLTAYERTGDKKYLGYVQAGVQSFAAMPKGLFSGGQYGYDPATKKLYQLHDNADAPHLAALMGGPEMWFEMTPAINDPAWTKLWLDYCRDLQMPAAEQARVLGNAISGDRLGAPFAKMTAFAAHELKDKTLADRAWSEFISPKSGPVIGRFNAHEVKGPGMPAPVMELPTTGTGSLTNETAQWCLNAIELLELVGDDIPPLK